MTKQELIAAAFDKMREAHELLADAGEHDMAGAVFELANEVHTVKGASA